MMETFQTNLMVVEEYEPDALTIPERVTRLLGANKPNAYCDDCIADLLRLRRTQVSMITSTLGLCRDYTRGGKPCAICRRERKFATHLSSGLEGRL